jgi:hypothetical protein
LVSTRREIRDLEGVVDRLVAECEGEEIEEKEGD